MKTMTTQSTSAGTEHAATGPGTCDQAADPVTGCCEPPPGAGSEGPLLGALDEESAAVRRAGFLALLNGEEVTASKLADRAGLGTGRAEEALSHLGAIGLVDRSEQGEIHGVAGLSTAPTRHRMVLGGRQHFTWCAFDSVGIPAALDADAEVRTSCGWCGAGIAFSINSGVPPLASALRGWLPTRGTHVRSEFCPAANLFCSLEHLERWRASAGSPAGEVADLEGLAELGRAAWGELGEPTREEDHG